MQTFLDIQDNTTTTIEESRVDTRPGYIFVLQLVDGRLVVGQANNAAKRIAAINSGLNRLIPKSHQVLRIVGIKPQTDGRTFVGTVKHFVDKYGAGKVIAV